MQRRKSWPDPVLLLALGLALLFCLHGIRWGRVECWNRDQMALRELRGWLPLDYQKPPLHTYLNHLLVLAPIDFVGTCITRFTHREPNLNEARLLGSRLLVVAMFLATVALLYEIVREQVGSSAARATALFVATSAGFIAFEHFLSCDGPLVFFMVLSLYFSSRIYSLGRFRDYLLAGLAAGLSAATKYNGAAIAIAIPFAHLLALGPKLQLRTVIDRRLLSAGAAVFLGFVIGNPGAVFDFHKFAADYTYNTKVAPVYTGLTSGHSYLAFLARIPEVVGWPGAILLTCGVAFALVRKSEFALVPASVFLFYFAIVGSFPRIETRFVLPAVPLLILIAAPLFQELFVRRWRLAIFVPLLLYNCICSFNVGQRFAHDPRMRAQLWVMKDFSNSLVMESSAESPHWSKLPGVHLIELNAGQPAAPPPIDWRMPYAYGRLQLFRRIFADDRWMQEHVAQYELEGDETLFTAAAREQRHPELIAIYSTDYAVPSAAIDSYYLDLLTGKFPYRIIFDGQTRSPSRWVYPQQIDFLAGRMTLLKRQTE